MIVDFQHHYVPEELALRHGIDPHRRQEVWEGTTRKVTLHERLYDLEIHLRDMDEAGIDLAVLSCFTAWDAPLEDCRLVNDDLARVQNTYSGRFVGLAHVPAHEPARSVDELRRAISTLGLKGVVLTSQIRGKPLDAPEFLDLYETISRLDVPIFVHPAMAPRGYALAEDNDLGRIVAREFDLCLTATRLIAGGILSRYPDLKFVIAHFGGGIAVLKERIERRTHRFDRPLDRPFADYFARLYFDMAGFEGADLALSSALAAISSERLVFATDYPQDFTGVSTSSEGTRPTIRSYIQAIQNRVSRAESDKMLGQTAARLLHL